jgi:hypothetical protein
MKKKLSGGKYPQKNEASGLKLISAGWIIGNRSASVYAIERKGESLVLKRPLESAISFILNVNRFLLRFKKKCFKKMQCGPVDEG